MNIAIIQNYFIDGGRLRWLAALVVYLNSRGITPEIVSYRFEFDSKHIQDSLGLTTEFTTRILPLPKIPTTQEMQILLFNQQVKKILPRYDHVINSSNSWLGIAKFENVIHYIHFPRKYRLANDIHSETGMITSSSWYRPIHDFGMKCIYKIFDRVAPINVIANSKFTASKIKACWPNTKTDVIYPPLSNEIPIASNNQWLKRDNHYINLGRFSPEKGQLKLMKAVENLPGTYHFIGFADLASPYYESCRKQAQKQSNVAIHPNLSNNERNKLLDSARYYIHTTINEPFGLSITESLSHGLLPIIHQSGGAQEIVPMKRLQYKGLEDISGVLSKLTSMSLEEQYQLLRELQQHSNLKFGFELFCSQWQTYFTKN